MPNRYFDSDRVDALVDVFEEAKRLLERQGVTDARKLDVVAQMILQLAYDGMPPWLILGEIMPPLSPEDAGLPCGAEMIDLTP